MPSSFLDDPSESLARLQATCWMEMTNADGRKYYFSALTRRVQWTRPLAFVAKDAPKFPSKRRIVGSATAGRLDCFTRPCRLTLNSRAVAVWGKVAVAVTGVSVLPAQLPWQVLVQVLVLSAVAGVFSGVAPVVDAFGVLGCCWVAV